MPTSFLIVGLGASAGGVDALKRFFEHVPADSGIAFVVILHLSPAHESRLADVVQSSAALPVTQVQERVRVEPNHVYVIPPSRSLSMEDGHLALSDVSRIEERRAPADIFFRTLAETHHARAVGVVLSGTGADGSVGLKHIKENGGLCFAQDPDEAEYGDMPLNSIATGCVDHVLPVAAIATKILTLKAHPRTLDRMGAAAETPEEEEEAALGDVIAELRRHTGHDFSSYKRATLLRRVGRRMMVTECGELSQYAQFARARPAEWQALLKDLLISVTHFFRDREAFAVLETEIIPKLFEGKGGDDQVRAWIAGCATGEEAYSLAILLAEYAASRNSAPAVQIFATDIDGPSIALARRGLYSLNEVADVPPERLRAFFTQETDGYRVRQELRQMVLFSQHNVIKDPPFSHLDLVSCRNLLIYLHRSGQRRVMEVAHFALKPGRFLFLGSSESVDGSTDLFTAFDKDANLYQSRVLPLRLGLPVPEPHALPAIERRPPERDRQPSPLLERLVSADLHHRLLEAYAPPSLVVNEQYEMVHLSTRAGRYLQLPGGDPSFNLLKVVRPELRVEVRAALYQAMERRTAVEAKGLALRLDDQDVRLNVTVRPVVDGKTALFVVLFDELHGDTLASDAPAPLPMRPDDVARQLEEEVTSLRLQLRGLLERHELHTEDHKASVEQHQAMNEELRSSAEELETSREELQSLNEELRTVNQELKIKIDEQARANDDMRNLVNATEIGTIFLDRALRIKLFTPAVRTIFNLIPADRGRPLSDINSTLLHPDLHQDVERVLETLERVEREVQTRDGRWLLIRVHPYRTVDDRIDGVVFTFLDVTDRKLAADRVQRSEERLRRATEIDNVGVMFFSADGVITDANDAFLRMSGYTRQALERRQLHWEDITPLEWKPVSRRALEEFRTSGKTTPHEREYIASDGARSWALCAAASLGPDEGVEFIVDITATKRIEEQLRRSETRLRLIVEGVTEYAIFSLDSAGCIDHWNPGAERMFGYAEGDIVGRPVSLLFTPEDRAAGVDQEELRQARESGRASDDRWHLRNDGTRFFVSGITTPLYGSSDRVLGYVKVARDLTDRKQWEDALQSAHNTLELRVEQRTTELAAANRILDIEVQERRRAEEQIRGLLGRIIGVQEDERRRIARDLHDHIGQQVVGLGLTLEALQQLPEAKPTFVAKIEDAQQTIARLDRDLDFFVWELRPAGLDDLGLVVAIRNFVAEWSRIFGLAAEFHSTGLDGQRLTFEIETNLYRILQEALNNVYKHAQATTVSVILERRGSEVLLVVEDDGRGFLPAPTDSADRGMGLLGIRERAALSAGTAEIESAPGKGTTIFVRVPLVVRKEVPSDLQ